jgi:ClpP class serine protease
VAISDYPKERDDDPVGIRRIGLTLMSLARAYNLLRAESSVWAMAPDRFDSLAAQIARGPDHTDDFWFAETPRRQLSAGRTRPAAPANTAIIPIVGPLIRRGGFLTEMFGLSSYDSIIAQTRQAVSDQAVDRILCYVDSPGGSAAGPDSVSQELAAAAKVKPTTAMVDGLACSAALWCIAGIPITATAESEIGSIGVFATHVSLQRALDAQGVDVRLIVSDASPRKVDGNPYEQLSEAAASKIQADVNKVADRFVAAVARGRGVTPTVVKSRFGQGASMFADRAVSVGLIDRVGTMTDALRVPTSARMPMASSHISAREKERLRIQRKLALQRRA